MFDNCASKYSNNLSHNLNNENSSLNISNSNDDSTNNDPNLNKYVLCIDIIDYLNQNIVNNTNSNNLNSQVCKNFFF